jgi:hypothetical protein
MAITTPGAVDYHLASQSGNLSINPLAANTLMCWINTGTGMWSGGARRSMVGTYNTATSGGTAIQIGTSSGAGECSCWTWGGTVLVGSTGITMVDNTWYHIAYSFDGTTHRLYINGVLNNTATTAQLSGTITAIYINGYPGGGTAETGTWTVDDVSYFNRTLTANEILTAYTTAGERDGIMYGNTADLLFSEGTPGSVANNCVDYSGNKNNLTPIGAATGVNFVYASSPIENDARPVQG